MPLSRLRVFVSYYRPYRRTLALDLLCAFVVSGVALAFPLIAGHVTRLVAGGAPDLRGELLRLGGLLVGLLAVQIAANTFVDYQGHLMGTFMERDMRRDLFRHLMRQPFAFYDRERTGQLMSRLTNDLFNIGELAHHGPEDLAVTAFQFLGVFAVLLHIDVPLSLLLLAFLPPMAGYALHFNLRLSRAMLLGRERIGDVNAQVEDTLSGIRVVQSLTAEAAEQRRFDHHNARFVHSRRAMYLNEAYYYQGMTSFTGLMTTAVLVVGGLTIADGRMRVDALVTYLLCVGLLMEPVQRLVNISRLLQEGVSGFGRFYSLMNVQPDLRDRPGAVVLPEVRGEIEFREVSFGYGGSDGPVIRELNLHIRPGEFVALVGVSGVGKSSLCALIPRFYDVSAGRVLVDGLDVRDVTLESLRRQVGVVQQDVYLFAGSVLDNLRYGRPDASREQVVAAARQAGAHDFILGLAQGYDTPVGQRGVTLSGGQKQRLSIARVFLKDPPILIFDEATSALDNESEAVVQASLERLARQRTTLVIAHRLSTVRRADRILVLTSDGIAEEGTHTALLRRGGIYADLHAAGARDGAGR